jgi:hemerythrin
MVTLEWDKAVYGIGIGEIDAQHKRLFTLFNQLRHSMDEGMQKQGVTHLIPELVDYAQNHFSTEEMYMEKYAYPGLKAHQEEHIKFMKEVSKTIDDIVNGKSELSIQVFEFLSNWITDHIGNVDKKLAPFLKEKGIK